MLSAGWQAHTLNAPGKFLVSAPEHGTPKRARGYLVTDRAVNDTAARHVDDRPELDGVSRSAITVAREKHTSLADDDYLSEPGRDDPQPSEETDSAEHRLWLALCMAPDEGTDIPELTRITGLRTTLYRRLREHTRAGRAVQVSRGRWRAQTTEEP